MNPATSQADFDSFALRIRTAASGTYVMETLYSD
jgi:hypothetical protein